MPLGSARNEVTPQGFLGTTAVGTPQRRQSLARRLDLLWGRRAARRNRTLCPGRLKGENAGLKIHRRGTPREPQVLHIRRARIAGDFALSAASPGAQISGRSTSGLVGGTPHRRLSTDITPSAKQTVLINRPRKQEPFTSLFFPHNKTTLPISSQ